MISQNWFSNKNFIMFNEYYEIQMFFDTNSNNIYIVAENNNDNTINITELNPSSTNYDEYYEMYENYLESRNSLDFSF